MIHDTYVYRSGRKWHWNCPCGAEGGPFRRRMDADDDASDHEVRAASQESDGNDGGADDA